MGALTQVLNYEICSLSSTVHVHAFPSTTLLCYALPSPPPLGSFFTHPSPDHSPHLSSPLCSLAPHPPLPYAVSSTILLPLNVIKFRNILYVYQ